MTKQKVYRLTGTLARPIDEVDALVAAGDADVVLDFAAATTIEVDGLEWLEELILRSKSYQIKVGFINVPPTIYKVFKVARIDSLLESCGALALSGPAC